MLSLMATVRPVSGPVAPLLSWVVTYQAPSSLPAGPGQPKARSGGSGLLAA